MKKRLAIILSLVMAAAAVTGCGKSSGGDSGSGDSDSEDYIYRVGFVNIDNADQNCYPAMQNFVSYVESDEFEKSVGHPVEVLQADSALDVEKQSTNVETLLTKGIDMLFMIGVDTEGNNAAVEECNAENIPVYMVGTEASSGEWKFVGFDETEFGSIQGDWCVENLDEGENICYLEGTPGREATTKRKEGFENAIAERDDLKILSSQTGEFDAEEAMNVTENWIQAYGDEMTCIVAADNNMALGASQAINAAGMGGKVKIVGCVGNRDDGQLIKDGDITAATFLYWPSIGTLCGEICEKAYLGEEIEERSNVELYPMDSTNVDELLDEYIPE